MPTIFTHAAVPLALGLAAGTRVVSGRLLVAGMLAAMLPDLDVVGFRLGVSYGHYLGHRGFSHSLLFALALGLLAACLAPRLKAARLTAFCFIAFAAASHGLLDMLTNGGRGVAFFWPFTLERYFAPWQPIEVSPLSLHRFLGPAGIRVLRSELLWVWAPCLIFVLACRAARRKHAP